MRFNIDAVRRIAMGRGRRIDEVPRLLSLAGSTFHPALREEAVHPLEGHGEIRYILVLHSASDFGDSIVTRQQEFTGALHATVQDIFEGGLADCLPDCVSCPAAMK